MSAAKVGSEEKTREEGKKSVFCVLTLHAQGSELFKARCAQVTSFFSLLLPLERPRHLPRPRSFPVSEESRFFPPFFLRCCRGGR